MAHILSFAGPKELCNFEQVSRDWQERVNSQASLWSKFCNGWKLRNEDELPLGFKDVVKTVCEIQACRRNTLSPPPSPSASIPSIPIPPFHQ